MRDSILILLIFGVVAGFLVVRFSGPGTSSLRLSDLDYPTMTVLLDGVSVNASVASTHATRLQGLSGASVLDKDEGMLFVFNTENVYSFWMKDMLIPIDIIWINAENQIVYIVEDAQPDSYPNQFVPDRLAQYVLEVQSGFVREHNISFGTEIIFEN